MVYLLMIAAVIAIDQITKNVVLSTVTMSGPPITVIDNFFYITCHRNSGAAWGLFQGGRKFFLVLTTVLLIVMVVLMIRIQSRWFRVALALIIGGAIGNFIDRFLVGGVVDFLDFYIFGYNFPTFNAADTCIVIGSALMVIYLSLFDKVIFVSGKSDETTEEETAEKLENDGETVGDSEVGQAETTEAGQKDLSEAEQNDSTERVL